MTAGRGIVHSERETSAANLVTEGQGLAHAAGETGGRAPRGACSASRPGRPCPRATRSGPRLRPPRRRRAAAHRRRGQARARRHGQRLRGDIAGRLSARRLFADAVLAPGAVLPARSRTTRSARCTWRPARSTSPATCSPRGGCWCSGPATASPSWPLRPSRLMLLGGAPMDGPRHIWWNFVSSSKERIEQAQGGLARRALRPGARRREGDHSAAGMRRRRPEQRGSEPRSLTAERSAGRYGGGMDAQQGCSSA